MASYQRTYAPSNRYANGDRLEHPMFGRGVVEKIDGYAAVVRFRNRHGRRRLQCAGERAIALKATPDQARDLLRWLGKFVPAAMIAECGREFFDDEWVLDDEVAQRLKRRKDRRLVGLDHLLRATIDDAGPQWGSVTMSGRKALSPPGQRRNWRFRKTEVAPVNVPFPDELDAIAGALSGATRVEAERQLYGLEVLQQRMLAASDVAVGWVDRGVDVPTLYRSSERATLVAVTRATICEYHETIIEVARREGPERAVDKIREVLAINGVMVDVDTLWGGVDLVPLGGPPLDPEFPEHLITDETEKQAARLAHTIGRPLNHKEMGIAREAAEERLRYRQNLTLSKLGVDLRTLETAERQVRRDRQLETERATRTNNVPSLRDRILETLAGVPDCGLKDLARRLKKRPAAIAAELKAMKSVGLGDFENIGTKQVFRPVPKTVPPYRVEGAEERLRIAEATPAPEVEDLNEQFPARRLQRRA
jgi:hypothetical protein